MSIHFSVLLMYYLCHVTCHTHFWTFYCNPNLHHFRNNTCDLIYFLSMTIDIKFMELIRVFLNNRRFVN